MGQVINHDHVRAEVVMADFVPMRTHVTDKIVKIKGGAYARTWKVGGLSFEAADELTIALRHDGLNQMLKGIGNGSAGIYSHKIRHRVSDRLEGQFQSSFCRELNKVYYDTFEDYEMRAVDMFVTVVYDPKGETNSLSNFFNAVVARSAETIAAAEEAAIKAMNGIARQVEAAMRKYDLEPLGEYVYKGIKYSSALELYAFLINGFWARVPMRYGRINEYLPTSRLFFANENIEIRTPKKTLYAAILDFADYPEESEPGILNPILYEDYDYIETQSYAILNKHDALDALKRQRGQLIASEDAADGQIKAINKAIEEVVNGTFVMGDYHYSLTVFGDSVDELGVNVGKASTALGEAGFKAALIDLVPDGGWWAQLPGNWRYRPREAQVSSRVFCGLSAFHNFTSGKRDGNPWGQAVAMLKTPSGQPAYVNFHTTPDEKDSEDDKALGNTMLIGGSGEGKTALKLMLLSMATKYDPTYVLFDKDRGEEIAVRRWGGKYFPLRSGEPTMFSPLKQPPTPRNKLFWTSIIKKLVHDPNHALTAKEEKSIVHAVETVAKFDRELRGLTAIRQNLLDVDSNSLSQRLAKWCWGGQLGWLLDCPDDELDLSTHKIYGFDYTDFLDVPEMRTPLMMYLMHTTESLIDGRRFVYGMAEFWKPLEDEWFSDFTKNKQKTIRKQNGLGVFDTQSPSDALNHPNARTLIEQTATFIFLPNTKATKADYVDGFKLTEAEWDIVSNFPEQSRMCLIKQGHRSIVASYDLTGMEEFLDTLSGSTDNIELLDQVLAELDNDDPDVWYPILRERIALRRSVGKKASRALAEMSN
jgi:type IV secretion system protein VirB4